MNFKADFIKIGVKFIRVENPKIPGFQPSYFDEKLGVLSQFQSFL